MSRGWLTKGSIPSERIDYVISLPDSETWRADFLGALLLLGQVENWEQFESLTPQEMADEWIDILLQFQEFGEEMIPAGTILAFGGSVAPDGFFMCDGNPFNRSDFSRLFDIIGVTFGVGNGTTTANLPNLKGKVIVGVDSGQSEFDVLGESGGSKSHTLTTAELATHTHTQNAHSHTQDAHTHTQNAHTHTQDIHGHNVSPHSHTLDGALGSVTGSVTRVMVAQNTGGNNTLSREVNVVVASATGVNQNSTPTNQNATPTNQNATPTNQNAGGGDSHNNLQPYITCNYIIKY